MKMSEFGFVLNIDLSLYFDDLRKFSSVFVDTSKCKVVRDIEKHIQILFDLDDDICLVNDKFLIPKTEDIQIVQHCSILRVHKCNFYDEQIHTNKKKTCEQSAVNLVQPEKTIDLSCRPKQRLKPCINQEKYVSTPKPMFLDTYTHKKRSRIGDDENEVVNNTEQQTQKVQQKKKKHTSANHSDHRENDVDIIDMSFNKIKKTSHDNCFVTSEDLSGDLDELYILNDHQHSKVGRKLNKRKKHCYHKNDCATHNYDLESSDCKNSTFSETQTKNRELDHADGDSDQLVHRKKFISFPESQLPNDKKKKKKKSLEFKNNAAEKSVENGLNENEESEVFCIKGKQTNEFEKCANIENKHVYDHLKDVKQNCQAHIDYLLTQSQTNGVSSFSEKKFAKSINFNDYGNIENDERSQMSEDDKIVSEEHSLQSSLNLSAKPKRKRKHAKKKKRQTEYYSAVGPILNDIVSTKPGYQPSPTVSEANHLFFTEEDFEEEIPIPPLSRIEEAKQAENGSFKSCFGSRDLLSQSCGVEKETAPSTWQQELLKLASSSTKPIIFHRNASTLPSIQTEIVPNRNQAISENLNSKKLEENQTDEGNLSVMSTSQTVNEIIDNMPMVTDNTKQANTEFKDLAIDVDCLNLNDYPIIKKVVNGDVLIFKILKLSENFEPEVSKTVLAKVLDSTKFPETITFDVLWGCDYKNAMKHNKCLIIDLKWMDLIEPRLFYP